MPVGELKERITPSEFLDWLEFIRREEARRTKIETYLAQIAAEVRRGYVKHPKLVKVQDFFLEKMSDEGKERIEKSKDNWMRGLGLKKSPKSAKK